MPSKPEGFFFRCVSEIGELFKTTFSSRDFQQGRHHNDFRHSEGTRILNSSL